MDNKFIKNIIIILILLLISCKISGKSINDLIPYLLHKLNLGNINNKNINNDTTTEFKKFKNFLESKKLKNKIEIKNKINKNIISENDKINIKKFIKNVLNKNNYIINNIKINSDIYYYKNNNIYEINNLFISTDLFINKKFIGIFNFKISLIFITNNKEKIFLSPEIFAGNYGNYKINDIILIKVKNKEYTPKINSEKNVDENISNHIDNNNNNNNHNNHNNNNFTELFNNYHSNIVLSISENDNSIIPNDIFISSEYEEDSQVETTISEKDLISHNFK